jgi:DNA primase
MRIPERFLDELRTRVPLHSIVSRRVDLKRSGNHWVGRCPKSDHDDKTPSFHVWDDHVKCFGCDFRGDCIGFVMETEKVSFREAVTRLAAEVGLEVPQEEESPQARHRNALEKVLDFHAARWEKALYVAEPNVALDYLRKRGISDRTIEDFGIGWAFTLGLSVESEALFDAGLTSGPESGLRIPVIRSRIAFPIRNRFGRAIGFTARTLDPDNPAKWINTRNTILYDKSRALFGIDKVQPGDLLVIVEGAMDVVACHQAGIKAVAPLGTSLTRDHLEEAWRICPSPILAMDGDKAGASAAERAIKTALPHIASGRTLKVAQLPPGQDPASIFAAGGGMEVLLSDAMHLDEALFDLVVAGRKPGTPEENGAVLDSLMSMAGSIQNLSMRGEYRHTLRDRFWRWRTNRNRPSIVHSVPDLHQDSTRAQQIEQLRQEIEDARVRLVELDEAFPEEMTKACNLLRDRVESFIEFMSTVEDI